MTQECVCVCVREFTLFTGFFVCSVVSLVPVCVGFKHRLGETVFVKGRKNLGQLHPLQSSQCEKVRKERSTSTLSWCKAKLKRQCCGNQFLNFHMDAEQPFVQNGCTDSTDSA